ncbi:hypothetical protein ACHAXT_003014 [Thalassiosira profunda]
MAASTWLSAAFAAIDGTPSINDDLRDILRAFGKNDADAPGPASLDPDADLPPDAIAHLQSRIATELLDEIDADQARMFGRRFSSVSTLLKEDGKGGEVTNRQLLRLALHRRAVQILSTEDPVLCKRRALRIRALVDFIWSQSLVIGLRDSAEEHPALEQLVRMQTASPSQYTEIAPGFHHATIEGMTCDFGPVHINVLKTDIHSCRMECVDARSTCTDLPTLAKQTGAVAAISGGFFLYSEPDIELPSKRTDPVGLLVSEGRVAGPPVFRRAAVVQSVNGEGETRIDLQKVGMGGVRCTLKFASEQFARQSIELMVGQSGVRYIHRGNAEEMDIEEGYVGLPIVGSNVLFARSGPATIPVPLAGYVLVFPQYLLPKDADLERGDATIEVAYELPTPYNNVTSAMAGGPMFFSDADGCNEMNLPSEDFAGSAPPVTFSQDETHDHNLLPRMGVGISKHNKQLICVAVDGRNLDRALGLTLQGTSDLLRSLGCTKAMNLDGGSSKRMVIWDAEQKEHKVVCLSTTEIKSTGCESTHGNGGKEAAAPTRPVHSAILFLPKED